MIDRRNFIGASLALASGTSMAQSQRVERIVVPFAAGGVQDLLARAISNELATALGQTVIVENRPGAGGTVGASFVARAAADSNTMILAAASHNISGSLYPKLPYDPQKDFRRQHRCIGLRQRQSAAPDWRDIAPALQVFAGHPDHH
jgi:tripartite-type tricarboxylate transporter receptor subunit TctC